MGGHDHGAAGQPGLDRPGHPADGGRVERRGRLVEQQDRGRAQEGAGQGHPLALTRAEGEAVLSQRRLPGRGADGRRGRRARRLASPRVSASSVAAPVAEAQVLGQRGGEEVGALGHPGEMGPPLRAIGNSD